MTVKERNTRTNWVDPDDAPEWPDDAWDHAQISIGGKVIRPATGTLTKRGRPPVGDEPKQQVTLRLAPKVIRYFRESGAGWQTRMNAVLERHISGLSGEHGRSMPRAIRRTGNSSKTAAASALTPRPKDKSK